MLPNVAAQKVRVKRDFRLTAARLSRKVISQTHGNKPTRENDMTRLVIIPDSMERAMKRDLDGVRDSLPEDERAAFDAERHIHRQAIIDHFADHGTYPQIAGVEKVTT